MNDYLSKFEALLVQLTDDERDEVVEFYREYLLDAGIDNYDDCVAELGLAQGAGGLFHSLQRESQCQYIQTAKITS
ncbi:MULTISPECIES: HAAS signaling domain-containing protein [Lactiplantibacillus]|uniref:HAAS signaling domain-containing protein n=1 Tax=Lactiplantibacillus TaxID=2767842 RepID=UPI0020A735DB|nr:MULTISPECIES: hypothetical protein [Lactiplantibacillus]